jgi:uncharacterized repeat protein (TIGR03847 family)
MELGPVDRITADAIGEPGQRVFYIQARDGETVVTFLVEKEQVQLLAASVLEILSRVALEVEEPHEADMTLEAPIEPLWRAGRLSIGYEQGRDLLVVEFEEQLDEEDEEEREPAQVRVWATRDQMLALSRHGAEVCSRGRPACELCGNPMDPEGHVCPATNGHKK